MPRNSAEWPRHFVPTHVSVFDWFRLQPVAASRVLAGEFAQRQVPESPVRTTLILFSAPGFDKLFRLDQCFELVGYRNFQMTRCTALSKRAGGAQQLTIS